MIKVNGKELTPTEVIETGKNNLKRLHKVTYKNGADLDEIEYNKDLIKRTQTKIKIEEIENKMRTFCSNKEYQKLQKKLIKLRGY
jgi:SRSO17 transposase